MKALIERSELEQLMQLTDSIKKRLDLAEAANEDRIVETILNATQGDFSVLQERVFQLWTQKT